MYSLSGLWVSCGYALNLFDSSSISNKFAAINLRVMLFDNYNCSFLFIFLPLLLSLIHSIYSKINECLQRSYRPSHLSKRMREEWIFYGLMFSFYACALSLGFPFMQSTKIVELQKAGIVVDALLMLWLLWFIKKIHDRSPFMGEFVEAFQRTLWPARNYYILVMIDRAVTASAVLLLSTSKALTIGLISLIVAQILVVVLLKPYTLFWKRKRPILNLSITLTIQIIYLLY